MANEVTVEEPGSVENTIIVPSTDLSEEILKAGRNVFEDTLPGKAVLEDTAVGLPAKPRTPTTIRLAGLDAAYGCHIGNVRERNEDSSFIFTAEFGGQEPLLPAGLYIVADGMGGHHAGHEASKTAAQVAAQHVLERIYLPLLHNGSAMGGHPQEPIGEVMIDAVQAANHHIHDNDPKKSSGTTLTAALILGKRLYVAHVGDSRAYIYADGELKLLTTDHSYVRRLQDAGQLTEEEAAVHPQRNMLYKAVGQGNDLDIDTFTKTLPKQGKLVLCSDGLWGLVPDESIAEVIDRDIPLPAMTEELVMLARLAGGHDNITAIVVDFNF
jgi:protein phosphatase